MNRNFTKQLEVGDKVVVSPSAWNRRDYVATVKRLTKTQIILDTDTVGRFRRKDGWMVGGDQWTRTSLKEHTPKAVDLIKRTLLADKIWSTVTRQRLMKLNVIYLKTILDMLQNDVDA